MKPLNRITLEGTSCLVNRIVFCWVQVVIPPIFRAKMLGQLHWEHPGICGMKAIARTCMWWPKMDQEIEEAVNVCTICQNV